MFWRVGWVTRPVGSMGSFLNSLFIFHLRCAEEKFPFDLCGYLVGLSIGFKGSEFGFIKISEYTGLIPLFSPIYYAM